MGKIVVVRFFFVGYMTAMQPFYKHKLIALWENFHAFLSSAEFFSKLTFSKYSFRNTIKVSNSLDPDQVRQNVGPDLVPNCLQKISADDTRR